MNIISRHIKPSSRNPKGTIVKKEAPIHMSNLILVDPVSGQVTRVGRKCNEEGKLQRYSKKTGYLYKMVKPRLQEKYCTEIVPSLREALGFKSVMQVPRFSKNMH